MNAKLDAAIRALDKFVIEHDRRLAAVSPAAPLALENANPARG